MRIEGLLLEGFRNYDSQQLTFDESCNVIYGDNAQGKTNLLEAIVYLSCGRSPRTHADRELIGFGTDRARLVGQIRSREREFETEIQLTRGRRRKMTVNGVAAKNGGDLSQVLHTVFFSPEDLNIIKNGPAERRRFLDSEICQLSRLYMIELANYNKVVAQRNKLLKEISFSGRMADTLEIWDEQMVRYGTSIISERKKFISRLNDILSEIHQNLTGGKEQILITYEPNVSEEAFSEELKAGRERDLRFGQSYTGPHRDDFCVRVNDIDIRKYGSQGQQRTAALSLKLAEIRLVEEEIHDTPVLLLDDVLSELDGSRQNYLLQSIHSIQTLITCTGLDEFVENHFEANSVFQVVEGSVFHKETGGI